MFERLPTPWGLVRLGVAPDHPKLKTVSRAFEKIAERPGFRFIGNVEVGRDLEPRRSRPAVRRRHLLHRRPDRPAARHPRRGSSGLVARDRVRRLVQRPPGLPGPPVRPRRRAGGRDRGRERRDGRRADARAHARGARRHRHRATRRSPRSTPRRCEEIVVVGRRGPAQAAFTTPELIELGELAGADVIVDPRDLEGADGGGDTNAERNLEVLREYAVARPVGQAQAARLQVPHLAGRDPRRRQGRGRRARPQPARDRRGRLGEGGPDGRARDASVRARLPQRRLPRRDDPGRPVRRAQGHDRERGRPGRAGRLRRRLDQARPVRRDRDEQEVRGRDRRAAPRGRRRRQAAARATRPRPTSTRSSTSAASAASSTPGWQSIDEVERAAGEKSGRPRVKLCTWDELLDAAERATSIRS